MNFCAIALISLVGSVAVFPSLPTFQAGDVRVPSISEVQQRAIAHARLEPSEISTWKKRVRLQALLPKLQLSYQRRMRDLVDIDINDSVYVGSSGVVVGPEEGSYSYNNDADQNVEVKAVWSLNEAIFNPDSLNVSAETRLLARERQMILSEVTKDYYDREKLLGEIKFLKDELNGATDPEKIRHQIFLKEVAFKEATAALDAYTGGWFSEQLIR